MLRVAPVWPAKYTAGSIAIPISPAIITTGPYKNVSGSPANDALLNFVGAASTSTPQGLLWHPLAFAFSAPPLKDVSQFGAWGARSIDKEAGISIRITRQYNITDDTVPCRLDVICGFVAQNEYWGCRIQS